MSTFHDRLGSEIERLGVSWVANAMCVARNTVYNWIGKGNVPLNNLMQLMGLGVDVVYVVTGEIAQSALSQEEQELVSLYRAAPLLVKKAAVAVLTSDEGPPDPAGGKYSGAQVGAVHEKAPKKMTIKQEFNTKKDK